MFYYSKTCPHCTNFFGVWKEFLKIYNKFYTSSLTITENNCTEGCKAPKYVTGYPFIAIVENGELVEEFEGKPRTLENLIEFVEKHIKG